MLKQNSKADPTRENSLNNPIERKMIPRESVSVDALESCCSLLLRNSDVAGVHNEYDLNMLTRVAERTGTCRVSCLGISVLLKICLLDFNREAAKGRRGALIEPSENHFSQGFSGWPWFP